MDSTFDQQSMKYFINTSHAYHFINKMSHNKLFPGVTFIHNLLQGIEKISYDGNSLRANGGRLRHEFLVFPIYFCPPYHFLTKEDVSLKF